MAYAYVQSSGTNTGNSSSARTRTITVTAGDLLVVAVTQYFAATHTVTDSQGNTYSSAGSQVTNGFDVNVRGQVFYAIAGSSGSVTITVTPSTSCVMSMAAHEYSGNASSSPLDSTANAGGSSTTPSSGSVTVSNAGSLLFGLLIPANAMSGETAGSGFTLRYTASANEGIATEDQVVSTNTAASFSVSSSINWSAIGVSFKPSTGGGGSSGWWFIGSGMGEFIGEC